MASGGPGRDVDLLVATIFVAFVGAVALLLILRLIRRGTPRRL